jgi:hypothetical protein
MAHADKWTLWLEDMIAYLAKTEPANVLLYILDYLVAAIFGAPGGALADSIVSPDFIK